MPDRRVIVFRSRLRPEHEVAFNRHADEVHQRAIAMPGFISSKDFTADDGERLTIVEWDSPENLAGWREDPAHREAQQLGRERYYARYNIQVCSELRTSSFDGASWTQTDHDPARLADLARRWLACFERRDLDGRIVASRVFHG